MSDETSTSDLRKSFRWRNTEGLIHGRNISRALTAGMAEVRMDRLLERRSVDGPLIWACHSQVPNMGNL